MYHRHTQNLSWVNSDLEGALDFLATTVVEAREKRASIQKTADDRSWYDVGGHIGDFVRPYLGEASTSAAPTPGLDDAAKHIGWGLGGAALGAAGGLGSSMLASPKRRRPLSSMLTGGLLGGALGAGGSAVHSNLHNLTNDSITPPPAPGPIASRKANGSTAVNGPMLRSPFQPMLRSPFQNDTTKSILNPTRWLQSPFNDTTKSILDPTSWLQSPFTGNTPNPYQDWSPGFMDPNIRNIEAATLAPIAAADIAGSAVSPFTRLNGRTHTDVLRAMRNPVHAQTMFQGGEGTAGATARAYLDALHANNPTSGIQDLVNSVSSGGDVPPAIEPRFGTPPRGTTPGVAQLPHGVTSQYLAEGFSRAPRQTFLGGAGAPTEANPNLSWRGMPGRALARPYAGGMIPGLRRIPRGLMYAAPATAMEAAHYIFGNNNNLGRHIDRLIAAEEERRSRGGR